ncbi:MAG TPA: hypothetical protein VFG72_16495 [Marmoricola sp.]|nr:hypothetical protein [Marmoricola sp.]
MTGPAVSGLEGRFGFTITVPDTWFELDVAPATRDESIRRLVEERVRGHQEMWEARHGITRILRDEARKAYDAGAAYAACMAMPTEDGAVTASVVVSLVRGPVGATLEGDPVGSLVDRLVPVSPTDDGRFTSVTTVDLEHAGTAARSYGVEDVPVDAGYVRTVFMQTMVPVPRMNKVFLLSASSPVVPLAAELHDLFDAVTGTFRLVELEGARG